jgi:hypothetical protein
MTEFTLRAAERAILGRSTIPVRVLLESSGVVVIFVLAIPCFGSRSFNTLHHQPSGKKHLGAYNPARLAPSHLRKALQGSPAPSSASDAAGSLMPNKITLRDPEAACVRKATATRRVGLNAQCACGEKRPEALTPKGKGKICPECRRKEEGKTIVDNHHVFAKANSPVAIPTPANDHRAELSVAQYDWPKKTLENREGSPFLAAAGVIRGFIDYIHFLIEKGLAWVVQMLEAADAFLAEQPARGATAIIISASIQHPAPPKRPCVLQVFVPAARDDRSRRDGEE